MSTRSAKLGGSAGGILAYLTEEGDLALGYYAGGGGASPRNGASPEGDGPDDKVFYECWGKGAHRLGIELGLTREQFQDLYAGRWNGEQLVGSGYRKSVDPESGVITTVTARTPVIDVVYGTPKSVAEYMVSADQQTRDAISEAAHFAAKAAFGAMEGSARLARKGMGTRGKSERLTADLIAVPVVQFTARPTQTTVDRGAPPDPHLHVHVPIFTTCAIDDPSAPGGVRWLTADEYGLKNRDNAEYRDAVFMGELARQLEQIGIEIEYDKFDESRSGRVAWEIKGSKQEARKFWSSNNDRAWALRRQFEAEHGRPMSDIELTGALKATRQKKTSADKAQDSRPVWSLWAEDARAAGIRLREAKPMAHEVNKGPAEKRRAQLLSRLYSPSGLCRSDSVFTGDTITPAVARCAVGLGFEPDELRQFEQQLREELVPVRSTNDDRFTYFTTTTILDFEKYIVDRAEALSSKEFLAPDPTVVERTISTADVDLDSEQRAAVYAACGSSGWIHIEGFAGSGKTTALKVIVDAHRKAGTAEQVVAVSTAANTAMRIGEKLGADRMGSVESFVRQVKNGAIRTDSSTLIVVDEAAMMDTSRMAQLLQAAGNARFVLVGDQAQLVPIGAGGWYGESIGAHGSVQLTTVHRQEDARDAADYILLRDGRGTEAVENLAERGRVHISSDAQARIGDALSAYQDFRNGGYSAGDVRIVLDSSNSLVDTCNRFIQNDLRRRGELGGSGFEVEDTEQDRRWTIHENDQVMFLNAYIDGTGEPVRNGVTGVVLELNPETGKAKLLLDTGRIVVMPLKEQARSQSLGLAYAQHASKLQGGEAPIVLVLPGSEYSASANSGYSQLTRAKTEAHIYLDHETHGPDPIDAVGRAWSVAEHKRTATWHRDRAKHDFNIADPVTAVLAHEVRDWLVEDHGEELADKITESEGYVAFVIKVSEMQTNDLDVRPIVAEAVVERSLDGAEDYAAVLSYRLSVAQAHGIKRHDYATPGEHTTTGWDWKRSVDGYTPVAHAAGQWDRRDQGRGISL